MHAFIETQKEWLRTNVPPFRAGDTLRLREWWPKREEYTGRELTVRVTYLVAGPAFGLRADYVCMAIEKI